MTREWRRLYRLRGIAPFGILLVVILAVLVLADRVSERWETTLQRRDELQQRLAVMRATIERSRQIDASLEAARGRMAAVSGKVVTAADAKAASQILGQAAGRWLGSMGAAGKGTGGQGGIQPTSPGQAVAEVSGRIMPRQLLRVLGEWQQAPFAMRLVRLELTVDNPDSPTALEALLRVEGVYQRPLAPVAEGSARGATEPRSARKQDAQ